MLGEVLISIGALFFAILLAIIISITNKSNVFFNYIRIKVKIIGLDIEIKSKKSTPSNSR